MAEARFRPNQFRHAAVIEAPAIYRDGRWQTFEPRPAVARELRGRTWWLRPGLTFTPYANPTRCNAHCSFCSEELLRRDGDRLTARTIIADHDRYFAGLDHAWRELAGFPMGMSLSGLEATFDPAWMLRLLALIEQHAGLFPEKVLYTNGSGLCTDEALLEALGRVGFDRIELSRCHLDEAINQRIMRFARNQPILRHAAFVDTVRRAQRLVPVKLSCILSTEGVCTVAQVEDYVREAAALGVERVVFRELSALGEEYVENHETRWIAAHRAPVRALMDEILPDGGAPREGWEFLGVTSGYSYYNEVYRRRGVEVILEGSSYVAHRESMQSSVLQKLVFHSTGDLCGDWVPSSLVIGNYFAPRRRRLLR